MFLLLLFLILFIFGCSLYCPRSVRAETWVQRRPCCTFLLPVPSLSQGHECGGSTRRICWPSPSSAGIGVLGQALPCSVTIRMLNPPATWMFSCPLLAHGWNCFLPLETKVSLNHVCLSALTSFPDSSDQKQFNAVQPLWMEISPISFQVLRVSKCQIVNCKCYLKMLSKF